MNTGFDESNILQDLDSQINEALIALGIPGISIGIMIDGKVALSKGYGYRNLELGLPVTENTVFQIASCTKAFTAFILGQLVDEGKITWDTPVVQYIPEFRLMNSDSSNLITVRDLLAHRTGMPRHDFLWFHEKFTRQDIIQALQYLEPACSPREKFQYNNNMYGVAGFLIEKITGQTWEEALSSRIFIPLGMVHSTNGRIKESKENPMFSLGYAEMEGKITAIPSRYTYCNAPAGAINSNVPDMLKWIQLQLSNGTLFDKKFIRKETLEEMQTIQMLPMMTSRPEEKVYHSGYGLGWSIGIYRGHYHLFHGGRIDGYLSQVSLLPQKKIGVVVLSNRSDYPNGTFIISTFVNTILDKFLGEKDRDWIGTFKKQKKLYENARQKDYKSNSLPSRKLEDYEGVYEHPGYGFVEVKLENNQLCAIYAEIVFLLNHKCCDAFIGEYYICGSKYTLSFLFLNNTSGNINEISISLEKTVKPVVFVRKIECSLLSIDYLRQFEGVFGENPLFVEICLKAGALFLKSSGLDIEGELVPQKNLKFSLKKFLEHDIQFGLDNEGKINDLLLTYPLGSFKFCKRE